MGADVLGDRADAIAVISLPGTLAWTGTQLVALVFICATNSDDMIEDLRVLSSPLNGRSASAELVPTDPLSRIKFCVL